MHDIPVITIDGPGGSGKGTIGLRLAHALNWHFLDSGALYRVLALSILNKKIALEDECAVLAAAHGLDVCFNNHVFLEGQPVTALIRSEECGNMASKIAVLAPVREALLERQRDFRKLPGLIADGRDMGTIVFPWATLKFFLEASVEERAQRRYRQLKDVAQHVNLERLLEELEERDRRDRQRVVAPLQPAEDAVVMDTTGMGIDAVFSAVMAKVKERIG